MTIRAAIAVAIVCAGQPVFAQPGTEPTPAGLYDDMAKDTHDQLTAHELPQIPATFALGLETTEIQRPGTAAELGATLVNALNNDSTIRTGVALEFAPFRAWKTNQFTAEQWVTGEVGYLLGVLDSVAISAATAENSTDAAGMRKPPLSSVGLRLDLVNTADLRRSRSYYGCVRKALIELHQAVEARRQPRLGENPVAVQAQPSLRATAKQAITKCEDERRGWVVEVAGALVATGEPAMATSTFSGGRAWASIGYVRGTLGATLQGDFWDRKEDRARRDWFAGARIDKTASTPVRFAVGLEAYYADTDSTMSTERQRRLGIGATADLKFDSGFVLSLGAQSRTDFSSELALAVLTKISFVLDGKSTDLYRSYQQVRP